MNKYDDIINMPHHRSDTHPHMSMHDRAAQFAPFAALTGHSALIRETARLTSKRVFLDDFAIEELNARLCEIAQHGSDDREYSITYFVPDMHKDGGAYVTSKGTVKKIDPFERMLIMTDGRRIEFSDIVDISSECDVHTDF